MAFGRHFFKIAVLVVKSTKEDRNARGESQKIPEERSADWRGRSPRGAPRDTPRERADDGEAKEIGEEARKAKRRKIELEEQKVKMAL